MRIAFARCLTHSDVTPPLQIAKSMKYACIHKISLGVAKDVCQRHSTRVLTAEYINDIVKIQLHRRFFPYSSCGGRQ